MIKLKNIKKNNDIIECDIIPEDSQKAGHLSVSLQDDDPYGTVSYKLPEGYEWCRNHVSHAVTGLIEMAKRSEFLNEKLIMWY